MNSEYLLSIIEYACKPHLVAKGAVLTLSGMPRQCLAIESIQAVMISTTTTLPGSTGLTLQMKMRSDIVSPGLARGLQIFLQSPVSTPDVRRPAQLSEPTPGTAHAKRTTGLGSRETCFCLGVTRVWATSRPVPTNCGLRYY